MAAFYDHKGTPASTFVRFAFCKRDEGGWLA